MNSLIFYFAGIDGSIGSRGLKFALLLAQVTILTLFLISMSGYIWPEETLLLYLMPAAIVLAAATVAHPVFRVFRRISFSSTVRVSMVIVSVLQVLLLIALLWVVTPRTHTRQQVLDDLDHALLLMEDMHPELYAATDRDSLWEIIDSLTRALPADLPEVESHKLFSTITAGIRDAHTMVSIDSYTRRGAVAFGKAPPYRFRIIGERIYVRDNYYWRDSIPIGSEILEINGKPSFEYLQDVSRMVSHETEGYRDAWLQYPLFWGLWNGYREFEISFVTPAGVRDQVTAASGLIANVSYLLSMASGQLRFGSYELLDGNVGYLKLEAFQGGDEFVEFLAETFEAIDRQNVRNLIIDIRGNSGGSTKLAAELMQYISPVDFNVFDASVIKISDELISAYSLDTSEFERGSMFEESCEPESLRDNPLRYDGRCYVLTSGFTFSTALDFAAMVRCFDVGEIVGTDTGGKTISYGSPHHFELPATGIKMKVSIKSFVNACGADNTGVIRPDHVVANTVEDDMYGIDRVLEYAIDLTR